MLLINFVTAQSGFFLKMLISSYPGKLHGLDKKFLVIVRRRLFGIHDHTMELSQNGNTKVY